MTYVNTTFLPKTSRLTFKERLVARANKGRVFGMGVEAPPLLTLNFGVNWVTPEPFLVSETVEAETASWNNAAADDTFRYRLQTRVAGETAVSNGSWTNYDGLRRTVSLTLPADETLEVRFHSQGKDKSNGDTAINLSLIHI